MCVCLLGARVRMHCLTCMCAHCTDMQADLGGTEILQPLQDVLGSKLIAGYTRQVFVLTDGEVSNTAEVIECVRRHQGTARLFALGLGEGASHELVEGIGKWGHACSGWRGWIGGVMRCSDVYTRAF